MSEQRLALLRRKEAIGTLAAAAWAYVMGVAVGILPAGSYGSAANVAVVLAWALTASWVAIDSSVRGMRMVRWTLLTIATGPVGFLLYYLANPCVETVCSRCGGVAPLPFEPCAICGRQSVVGRVVRGTGAAYSELVRTLAGGPLERSRETSKHMAFALAGVIMVGLVLSSTSNGPFHSFVKFITVLATAGYWVLLAWWVYLDATWRRMDAIPWAILALVTNFVGLVTYLVIRYPDPKTCSSCGASLAMGLKRCPYCGAEAEPSCPRCQAPVRPDWVFCPSCSAKLVAPPAAAAEQTLPRETQGSARLSVSGTVADAVSGAPIPGADVRVDSRSAARATTSDSTGRFIMADLQPGAYVLIASAEGFRPQARAFTPDVNGSGKLHFTLQPDPSATRGAGHEPEAR